jgi:hypothetical protein
MTQKELVLQELNKFLLCKKIEEDKIYLLSTQFKYLDFDAEIDDYRKMCTIFPYHQYTLTAAKSNKPMMPACYIHSLLTLTKDANEITLQTVISLITRMYRHCTEYNICDIFLYTTETDYYLMCKARSNYRNLCLYINITDPEDDILLIQADYTRTKYLIPKDKLKNIKNYFYQYISIPSTIFNDLPIYKDSKYRSILCFIYYVFKCYMYIYHRELYHISDDGLELEKSNNDKLCIIHDFIQICNIISQQHITNVPHFHKLEYDHKNVSVHPELIMPTNDKFKVSDIQCNNSHFNHNTMEEYFEKF